MDTLRSVKEVEIVTMPRITQCRLPNAFKRVEVLKMKIAGRMKELTELRNWERKKVVISCKNDWERIDVNLVVEIVVSNNCCEKEEVVRVVDLSGFVSLRELNAGRRAPGSSRRLPDVLFPYGARSIRGRLPR